MKTEITVRSLGDLKRGIDAARKAGRMVVARSTRVDRSCREDLETLRVGRLTASTVWSLRDVRIVQILLTPPRYRKNTARVYA
jgi:hypothetical protein